MSDSPRLMYLLARVHQENATSEEYRELRELINSDQSGEIILQLNTFYTSESNASGASEPYDRIYWQQVAKQILQADKTVRETNIRHLPAAGRLRRKQRIWWAAAAAVLILISTGAVYFLSNKKSISGIASTAERFKNDVAPPQRNKAILTLAGGEKIILDSAGIGALYTQGNTRIVKLDSDRIAYAPAVGNRYETMYNTITVPRGSKVLELVLPDGSRVWLDAASSITYPVAFTGGQRKVEITGQLYFEVAHNPQVPFIVKKANSDVEIRVLGTHFNVNAYDDEEALKVTLLEGKVKVSAKNEEALLKPGEQAEISSHSPFTIHQLPDPQEVIAWKNGIFKFRNLTIAELMKQVSRWYDVNVVFEGGTNEHFISTIPRNTPASTVFRILETTGRVHFKIDGNTITVMP